MNKPNWRHQFDAERDRVEREKTAISNHEPSKTIQSFREDTDINVLMKRFGVTDGAIPPAVLDPRFYGDFSDVVDFRGALDATREAEERFRALPASIRNRFGNDPLQLWQFVNDEANAEESIKLGLLKRQPAPNDGSIARPEGEPKPNPADQPPAP